MSAAILDDVIGIVMLSLVLSLSGGAEETPFWVIPTGEGPLSVLFLVLIMLAFFALSIGVGILVHRFFDWMGRKYPHHRRLPMVAFGLCFLWAWLAEVFHIADITGAYVAGIILCNLRDAEYIAGKMDISSYMLFGPVFFASIGLNISFEGFTLDLLWFSIAFVVVALIGKIVGCGLVAKCFKNSWRDSLKIGVGMMTRGEVALIVANKGLAVGMVEQRYFLAVILLIIVSSISVPIILKLLFKGSTPDGGHPDESETEEVPAEV